MLSKSSRLNLISSHLTSKFPQGPKDKSLEAYTKGSKLNSSVISQEFHGSHHDLITFLRASTKDSPLFNHQEQSLQNREALHQRVFAQVNEIYSKSRLDYEKDLNDPIKKLSILQVQGEYDMSTSTRCVVSLCLYADTIQNLGTSKHRTLIDRLYSSIDYGCFAMTEIGHGSDVAGLETTATYEKSTNEFVFNSPTRTSAKWWIGAAGKTANMAVVWAQLWVNEEPKGVHPFVLEIRDFLTHEPKSGVVLGDCGEKIGLNGIDNGFIIFSNYRAPYSALLDKFCSINAEGKYKSAVKNADRRLGVFLAGLIRGRFCVILGSEVNLRNSLTIALRYSALRKQFGYPEMSILDYPLHRSRLVPHLARLFAIRSGLLLMYKYYSELKVQIRDEPENPEIAELHAILCCFKAISSGYALAGIQECRESTGGHGYSEYSAFGRIRNGTDIMLTWEGDNNVLIQQCGKYILKQVQAPFKGGKITAKTLQFLKINREKEIWPINVATDISNSTISAVFEAYINCLAYKSAVRLQESSSKFANPLEIWNNSQVNYFQTLCQSYGEYLLYQEFYLLGQRVKEKCEVTGKVIENLCELYALDVWEKKQRIYNELACTADQAGIIRERHCSLYMEIGDEAIGIINSVASTDRFIGSVIGNSDGQAYSRLIDAVEMEKNVYGVPSWVEDIRKARNSKN